jgi:ethanolamine ammonia-lyase large subunit
MRYRHTVGTVTWQFADLRELMAKATPARSGDVLAGLAEVPLRRFLDEPLVPYRWCPTSTTR